jgi:chromosome segregation ATPase
MTELKTIAETHNWPVRDAPALEPMKGAKMTTATKEIRSKIGKLTGKKDALPAQLATVREKLAAARQELGLAILDDKSTTDKLRGKVADLQAQEAGLVAALESTDIRLDGLGDELLEAERAEITAALVEANERLGSQAEQLLSQLFDVLEQAQAMAVEIRQLQTRARRYADLQPGELDLHSICAFSVETYRHLRQVVAGVRVRHGLGGGPQRFGPLLAEKSWKHH